MLNIAVLQGGCSAERDISLKTGAAVVEAIEHIGHDVTAYTLEENTLSGIDLSEHDFAFICLHGGWGEGGGVQSELEALGIPYSGSGPVASKLALDKELSKAVFLAQRVPTPAYEVAGSRDAFVKIRKMAQRFGFPLVIKPACEGSSFGVTIARNLTEAQAGLEEAFKYDAKILIEQGIVGRELTVAIVEPRALPVVEIAPGREFYDYDAKYVANNTLYIKHPQLTEAQAKLAQHFATRAHNALRCSGFSRVDLMLAENGQLYVLEVNTLPGMTSRSLVPLAADAAGMGYEEVLQAMIDASMDAWNQKQSGRRTRLAA